MHHQELRELMLTSKPFLKKLFVTKQFKTTKNILLESSNEELNVLINILFHITQGDIPIKKINYKAL